MLTRWLSISDYSTPTYGMSKTQRFTERRPECLIARGLAPDDEDESEVHDARVGTVRGNSVDVQGSEDEHENGENADKEDADNENIGSRSRPHVKSFLCLGCATSRS